MYKFLTKNGLVLALVLGVLVIAVHFIMVGAGLEAYNAEYEIDQKGLVEGSKMVSAGLTLTAVLFVIAVIAMLGFGIYQVATNPKGAMKGIIGLAAILAIFGIGYATSAGEVDPVWNEKGFGITEGISKYVSGGITASAALITLAVLGLVVSEIRNFFK